MYPSPLLARIAFAFLDRSSLLGSGKKYTLHHDAAQAVARTKASVSVGSEQ